VVNRPLALTGALPQAIRHCDELFWGAGVLTTPEPMRNTCDVGLRGPSRLLWWSKVEHATKSPVDFVHQAWGYLPDSIGEVGLV
jgi:hypothetical protein